MQYGRCDTPNKEERQEDKGEPHTEISLSCSPPPTHNAWAAGPPTPPNYYDATHTTDKILHSTAIKHHQRNTAHRPIPMVHVRNAHGRGAAITNSGFLFCQAAAMSTLTDQAPLWPRGKHAKLAHVHSPKKRPSIGGTTSISPFCRPPHLMLREL